MRRVTIDEVAERAGVSVATVSRAVRGLPNVSPATRKRVLQAAGELKYRPDPNASRLAAGKSGVVIMAVPTISSWYTAQAMAGVEAVLQGAGIELSVTLLSDSSSRDRVVSEPGLLASRADALVLLDLVPTTFEPDSRFPVVVVGDHSDAFDSVSIDNVHGGRIAGEHLVGLGHSRVGLIAGAEEDKFTAVTMLRTRGLEEALAGVGVSLEENAVVFGHYSGLGGYEAMNELLARPNPPTAVFALSDDMALGAIRAATEAGMSIPHDVSIVGFDDHELSFVLGLTTVAQDPAGLGAAGAQMLLDRLEGHSGAPREAHGEVRLIERSSTARI